ncbi:MAG TPA: DUF3800 domain-containing protein [Alphaproteobacteria bacterium]|nr:DUF3800 domain-containing protein [Alphaproteobacteria bacterium]
MLEFSDYIIFVDESGDHSLDVIDRDYPVFVLNFCIFQKARYAETLCPRLQEFKFRHFGHDHVILHEHAIRKQVRPFVFLKSEDKREAFVRDLTVIIAETEFVLVSAVIDKRALRRRYVDPSSPYDIALLFCMERAHAFLRGVGQAERMTHVIVECRGAKEDAALELQFRRICAGANLQGRMDGFEIVFADKKANLPGLQIADLTARPIGRHVINPAQPNRAFDVLQAKFRRSAAGRIDGWGMKVFP